MFVRLVVIDTSLASEWFIRDALVVSFLGLFMFLRDGDRAVYVGMCCSLLLCVDGLDLHHGCQGTDSAI